MLKKIETSEQFAELVNNEKSFFLLKHSLTCPISQAAFNEYEKFSTENKVVDTYYLAVQDARPLSNEIAEKFQIKHESPQAILFANGEAKWNASHWKITNSSLENALKENA
ncbi:bacillithiol system redox-active protein YtxJ [Bacillus sp. BRMEA1]|uniref:bacillithiol system redox-active protein YtxJ n=1 Tax=Neobacillus endophyticus TaxID=2738405 RepID=UPI001565E6F0|nr:bacillithiol system redox-active protein YtxJ [Neobacillus endophyticus]NRD76145.1 bacillithiol system redox-active protein YtxJ [Neobacillus endophyticus]